MSVQSWLDSEARRLLAEELQADATEARRPSPNDPKGDR